MPQTRVMRLLRFRHNVSLAQLARAAKVSPQRISQMELGIEPSTEYQRELIREAFAIIADERGQDGGDLRRDLRRLEYRLLDYVREGETL